ncbi:MAG: bifunctional alpha,alpha-trehalose-phosphate synthase (UDP-forming)/trehalose-phosphatase, partial [Anaerolineae bacterium]|nr:bifunctional alpha,alpha-trehalose-phosphate synthase (UDP-forming)/trehalose-phosphatase [Anaerolineae bacterium]
LKQAREARPDYRMRSLSMERRGKLLEAYREADRRLLLLDYDGTLVGFRARAESAVPDARLLELLKELREQPGNTVVVISG